MNRTSTRRQRYELSFWHRHYLRLRGWRLVPAFQAHPQQFGAHGVTAVPEAAGDLPGAVATGPEFFEKYNAGSIPHGYCLTANGRALATKARLGSHQTCASSAHVDLDQQMSAMAHQLKSRLAKQNVWYVE